MLKTLKTTKFFYYEISYNNNNKYEKSRVKYFKTVDIKNMFFEILKK